MRRIEVKTSEINSELLRVWSEAAEQDKQHSGGDTRVRAVLSNLVLLVDEKAETEKIVNAIIDELSVSHPSRFFIVSRREGLESIQSSVSSRCVLARNRKHVCSEEIYLRYSTQCQGAVANVLLSLFVSDIPTSLVFLGDPQKLSEDGSLEFLRGIESVTDLIISDSTRFESFQSGLKPLINGFAGAAALAHGLCFPKRLRDMSWRRLRHWRALITEQFDMPRLSESIDKFSYIQFDYKSENERVVPPDVILLAGWMLTCLQWEPKRREEGSIDFRVNTVGPGGDTPSLVFVNRGGSGADASSLTSVSLELEVSNKTYRLHIERDFEQQIARVEFCKEGVCEFPRTSSFSSERFEERLIDELYSASEDQLFSHAAENALKLEMLFE